MEQQQDQPQLEKWQGQVSADLPTIKADQAWSLLSDFCSLHLYLPGLDVCEKFSGTDNVPGCIRFTAAKSAETGEVTTWAKEELLELDDVKRSYSYVVVGSNMGFGSYVANLNVLSEEDPGCKIEWCFECEPVPGWSKDGLVAYLGNGVRGMAKAVEEAVQVGTTATTTTITTATTATVSTVNPSVCEP